MRDSLASFSIDTKQNRCTSESMTTPKFTNKRTQKVLLDTCDPSVLIDRLLGIINNDFSKDSDKIKAINLLLQYRDGLPKQQIDLAVQGPDLSKLSDQDLAEIRQRLNSALAEKK